MSIKKNPLPYVNFKSLKSVLFPIFLLYILDSSEYELTRTELFIETEDFLNNLYKREKIRVRKPDYYILSQEFLNLGYVTEHGPNPKNKTLKLTSKGKKQLISWVNELNSFCDVFDKFLDAVEE